MEPERDHKRDPEHYPIPQQDRPPEADLLTTTEPDAELAVAYAAWRLDQAGRVR